MDSHFSVSNVARLHGLILFRLYGFAYDGFIVPVYDLLHVRFATVAHFDSVPIEDLIFANCDQLGNICQ